MMSRQFSALGIAVAALVLAAPGRAEAAPFTATGGFTQNSFVVTGSRTADGVTFFTFTETDSLSGALTGTSTLNGECIQRTSGPILCQARETFTGTVSDASGTAEFLDVVSIDPTSGTVSGHFTIVGGTDELVNLHGQGTFQGQGTTGTYEATLVFG